MEFYFWIAHRSNLCLKIYFVNEILQVEWNLSSFDKKSRNNFLKQISFETNLIYLDIFMKEDALNLTFHT